MKKLFAATTALVSVALVAPAMAQESPIKVSLGGKLRHFFFVSDQDETAAERLNTAGMSTDAEFYLKGETTLESGLRVGITLEEEAESRSDRNGDEAYIDFRDTWGRIRGDYEIFYNNEPFWRGALSTDFKKVVEDAGFKDVRSGYQDATPKAVKGKQAFHDKSKGVHASWFIVSGVK